MSSNIKTESGANNGLPVSVGAVSEVGLRDENQDNMTGFASPLGSVYLIADGMGGYQGGAEASRVIAEVFRRQLMSVAPGENYWDALARAARGANEEMMARNSSGDPQFAGMGSTVVLALIRQAGDGLELITAHAGDSRVYLGRGGSLTLLTKDHTRVQWLIDNHTLDEAAARLHPEGSVLTRAFGHTPDLAMDIGKPISLADGDSVLLCSDGLSGFAGVEEINQVIGQNPDPSECVQQLVQLALARGSNDNITVQFIRVGRSPRRAAPQRAKRRETLPEGLAISAPAADSSKKKLQLMGYVAFGALAASLLAGTGVVVYRKAVKPAPAVVTSTSGSSAELSRVNRSASAAVKNGERVEALLDGKIAKASGSKDKKLQKDKVALEQERTGLLVAISNPTPDPAEIRKKTKDLIDKTKEIESTDVAANTAPTSAKGNK